MFSQTPVSSRNSAGCKTGWMSLGGNLFLALIKLAAGFFSNSIAIFADALNNLTDCASSLLTVAGFALAARAGDWRHPYGHGRMEYVCGFLISNLMIATAVSVGKDSVGRLLHPQAVAVSGAVVLVLTAGIVGKLLMAWQVGRMNKAVDSPALRAVRNDNLSDALVTAAALTGVLLTPFTALPVDAVLGFAVALFILWSGITAFGENLVLLLGEGADPATEQRIREILSDYPLFAAVVSVDLHDYGPDEKRVFIKVAFREPHDAAAQTLADVRQRLWDELALDAALYWDAQENAA